MRRPTPWRRIGELISSGCITAVQDGNHGGSHPKASEYVTVGLPFVMASDIRHGRLYLEDCKRLAKSRTDQLRVGFARSGDVLLTHKGTVGEVAIVPPLPDYVMLTPQVTYYRVDDSYLSAVYLSLAFRHPEFQSQLLSISAQSTRNYVAISTQRLLEIPWFDIHEQRRIASILSAYDDLIEVNRRRVAILEEMARRLFEEWFVHLRFPGHEAVLVRQTPDGPLPEGWSCRQLGQLVTEERDTVLPVDLDGTTMYVGLEHIPRRSTTLTEWGSAEDVVSAKLRFQPGDILFGKIRPYFHKIAIAPAHGVSSTDAIVLRSRAPEHAGIVAAVAASDAFVAQAVQTSNGTKMPRANWTVLARYPVRLPPEPLLYQFNSCVIDGINHAISLAAANTRLTAARDLLLPRLVSGELSVADAPTPDRLPEAAD